MENFKKRCVLEALIAEREGMIAENKQREYLQQAMAYGDNSFFILADNIRTICKEAPDEDEPDGAIEAGQTPGMTINEVQKRYRHKEASDDN